MAQPEAEERDRRPSTALGTAPPHTDGAALSLSKDRGSRFTVLVIALMVLSMLALGLFAFRAIGERPRAWSYGTHPLIPAETYSSTQPAPPPSQSPKQIELPPLDSARDGPAKARRGDPEPVEGPPRPVRPQPGAKGAK
jgi:hypothetical protein